MFDSPFTLLSPAKINLFLKVTGKRKDGYHNLATLLQMIDLCDKITFSPAPKGEVTVTCSAKTIKFKDNLAYRAAISLWKPGLQGVSIHVEKSIPIGAGLGGGSSNAATTLFALNRIWNLNLPNSALRIRATRLGADVPFFLFGPRAWATGIGEKLRLLPNAESFHILLVKPRINVSTRAVYSEFNRLTNRARMTRIPLHLKGVASFEDSVRLLTNELESTVINMYPVIGKIKNILSELQSEGVVVSGTGASIFALYKNLKTARSAYLELSKNPWWCTLTKPLTTMGHLKIATLEQGGRRKWR